MAVTLTTIRGIDWPESPTGAAGQSLKQMLELFGDSSAPATSLVVAASDAPDRIKNLAWAVCDGEDDQEEINAALAESSMVFLSPGLFHAHKVQIPSGRMLIGAGMETEIRQVPMDLQSGGKFGTVEVVGSEGEWIQRVIVSRMRINGNKGNMLSDFDPAFSRGEGIDVEWAKFVGIYDVFVHDSAADGVDLDNCEDCKVVSSWVKGAAVWGIHQSNGAERCQLCLNHLVDNGIEPNGGGIDAREAAPDSVIVGNIAINNRQNYQITSNSNCVFVGNQSISGDNTGTSDVHTGVQPFPWEVRFDDGLRVVSGNTRFEGGNVFVGPNNLLRITRSTSSGNAIVVLTDGESNERLRILANGEIRLGGGSAGTDVILQRIAAGEWGTHTGTRLRAGSGAWNAGHLRLGSHSLWIDSSGNLRIKDGLPSSHDDGVIVGSQGS